MATANNSQENFHHRLFSPENKIDLKRGQALELPFRPPQPRQRKTITAVNSTTGKDRHPPNSKSCNIIFLGTAGSGKSTTIKKLFSCGNEKSADGTGTQKILEYSSDAHKLKFLDTPGLGSLYRLQWDARIIASLKLYLDKINPDLQNSIPHAVIITHKFDDPSIHQLNSNFGRCLQAINTLNQRLFSSEYCNLIVLLTHFMSARKIHRDNSIVKIQMVRELVRKTLNKSCHVILGENDAENWGLPKSNGRGYKLPSSIVGDIYPNNLIDMIQEVMSRGSRAVVESEQKTGTIFLLNCRPVSLTKSIELIANDSKRYQKAYEAVQWAYGNITITL